MHTLLNHSIKKDTEVALVKSYLAVLVYILLQAGQMPIDSALSLVYAPSIWVRISLYKKIKISSYPHR